MKLGSFALERLFAEHEFSAPFLLSASDCESLTVPDLLALADAEMLEQWQGLNLGYTESQGHPLLRQEIALLHTSLTADDVLVVVPEEGIFLAMNVLLGPGDHVIVTFPGYQSLYEVAQALGCRVTRWKFAHSEAGWQLDLNFLAHAITSKTKLLVMNFPHNPTGFLPALGELDTILDLARRHNLYVFSDEMYRLLEYDPASRLPPFCDVYERGISLFGLSKTFSLPGLRVGWLSTTDRALLREIGAFKDYTTICSSAPSELLAIIALRARDAIVARNLEIICQNLDFAEQFFAANSETFQWFRPHAGSVAFPRLNAGMPVETFCERMLREKGVMIVPGTMFEYPGDHFRLGLGRKNLPEALTRVVDT
jgi:aspartate/methionine/tyrosine aminotransferase